MSDGKQVVSDIDAAPEAPEASEAFETLLLYLKQSRGFDFTAYKRSSLMRRVRVRMQSLGITEFADYQDFLQVDPDEFTSLFNTILINVTSFFRDAQAWDYLASSALPELIAAARPTDPIRVWSAGCASGEEAYTAAMLFAEALGPEQFRDRVKIYGTDVDEEALTQARHAMYGAKSVEDVPPHLRVKYFDQQEGRFVLNKEVRRSVIFGRHDLLQDAPISRINLLICRNCLMYFNSDAQSRILSRFHFALNDGGLLFLGKAETLLAHASSFGPADVKRRLFTKTGAFSGSERYRTTEDPSAPGASEAVQRLLEAAADASPVAQLLVDYNGAVIQVNGQMREVFGIGTRDIGRPLQDLELSYRPFELRSSIERAYAERRPVGQDGRTWIGPAGQTMHFDLLVVPVPGPDSTFLGCSIIVTDVTRTHRLQAEIERAQQELQTSLEELQSTNEELETTNEELQSTVEELETTNEELQSTNEELETMNEELQSTNQELQTINEDARERSEQLADLNLFLESILASLRAGVVMLDRDLQIHKWNRRSEDMWGLRAEEVYRKNFLNLDIGLPVDKLKGAIRSCLSQAEQYLELTVDAINRRGKPIRVKVTCTQLRDPQGGDPRGVILLMEEADGKADHVSTASEETGELRR